VQCAPDPAPSAPASWCDWWSCTCSPAPPCSSTSCTQHALNECKYKKYVMNIITRNCPTLCIKWWNWRLFYTCHGMKLSWFAVSQGENRTIELNRIAIPSAFLMAQLSLASKIIASSG
jgi:hypothetical protein